MEAVKTESHSISFPKEEQSQELLLVVEVVDIEEREQLVVGQQEGTDKISRGEYRQV